MRDPCQRLAFAVLKLAYKDYLDGGKHKQSALEFFMGRELDAWCRYFRTLKPEVIRGHIHGLEELNKEVSE